VSRNSRAQQAKRIAAKQGGAPARVISIDLPIAASAAVADGPVVVPPIPDLTRVDLAFGNVKHLPAYSEIPEDFRRERGIARPYCEFISSWFFGGRTAEDMQRLVARPGVDRTRALVAIRAILASFEPKHEHKKAGAAYLLSAWFRLT
jgi:hypothetical protein